MSIDVCIEIPEVPDPQHVILPGGVTLESTNLLAVIQPALAPFMPLFDIVEAVTALFEAIKKLPTVVLKLIGPPPDPNAINEILPLRQIAKLAKLMPQLAVPLMLVGILDLLINTLQQARAEFVHLQSQASQVASCAERAKQLNDLQLMSIAECMRHNVAREATNIGKQLGSLGHLFGLVGQLSGLIGGPKIPDIKELGGHDLGAIIQPLDALLAALRSARMAIPIPS